MLAALASYRHAIALRPSWLGVLLLVSALAALMEGSALILLIPILDPDVMAEPEQGTLATRAVMSVFDAASLPPTQAAMLAAFLVAGVVSVLLTWTASSATHAAVTASEAHMRARLYSTLMFMRWPSLARIPSGTVVKGMTSDVTQAGLGILFLLLALTAGLSGMVYAAIAIALSWQLALVTVGFAALLLPVYLLQMRRTRRLSAETDTHERTMAGQVTQSVEHSKYIFGQGLRRSFERRFGTAVQRFRRARIRRDVEMELARMLFELSAILFVALVLFLVISSGVVPIATALVFLAVFIRLAPRIVVLQGNLLRAANYAVWIENWRMLIAQGVDNFDTMRGTRAPSFIRSIELRSASFHYEGRDYPAVEGVDLTIPAGATVAVMGPSGHGKSTIVALIVGLVAPQAGEVLIDGVATPELDIDAWRAMVGFVPQEAPVFGGTVADNLLIGSDAPADRRRMEDAARIAEADDFVRALPHGFDTEVGERGAELSGGQRHRLAIARALYRAPRLLILDEPTAALDAATAARLMANLRSTKGDLAILVVTHDAAVAALADTVYRIEQGRISAVSGDPPLASRIG